MDGRVYKICRLTHAMAKAGVHGFLLLVLSGSALGLLAPAMRFSGLNRDDAHIACAALQMTRGDAACQTNSSSLSIARRRLPLITSFYRGPWEIYALAPFLGAIDDPKTALQAFTLFWAVLCVLSTYGLAYALSGDLLLSLLCGLSLAASRALMEGVTAGFVMSGIVDASACSAALMCLVAAARNRSSLLWRLSCLLTGLGAALAQQAFAFLAAWTLCVLGMRSELRRRIPFLHDRRQLLYSALLVVVWWSPMLLANCLYDGFTLRLIARNLASTSAGIHNASYLENMSVRVAQARDILNIGTLPPPFWAAFFGLCHALTLLGYMWGKRRGRAPERARVLPAVFTAVIFLLSGFTLYHLGAYHLFILLPLGLAAAAATPASFPSPFARRALRGLVAACLLWGIWGVGERLPRVWALTARRQYGADRAWAVYPLSEWLKRAPVSRIILLDPHLPGPSFSYLSGRALDIKTMPWDSTLADHEPWLDEVVRSGTDGYFIDLAASRLGTSALLSRIASKHRKKLRELAVFRGADGGAGLSVYALEPERAK